MLASILPDSRLRKAIEVAAHADNRLCWTCNSCNTECPVNIATDRLQPLKIVHMANLGLLDNLLHLPEIWYCLTCNCCKHVCPMAVRPSAIIGFLRNEILRRGLVSYETLSRYHHLLTRFQWARYHLASCCLNERDISITVAKWYQWLETPPEPLSGKILYGEILSGTRAFKQAVGNSNSTLCLTCKACSSVCPVFGGRAVFDPVWIFRMMNFGLADALFKSPSIWLCLACQRCTDICSQQIHGHLAISSLQKLAVDEGFVDKDFPCRWKMADKSLYPFLLSEIDSMFGFSPQ